MWPALVLITIIPTVFGADTGETDNASPESLFKEEAISAEVIPLGSVIEAPHCKYTVHKYGPQGEQVDIFQGEEVASISLEEELYHRIDCSTKEKVDKADYCLLVYNCSVATADDAKHQIDYQVIDAKGCTLEPQLFEHVEYENDLVGGIMNPLPVRFRGADNRKVMLRCRTSLIIRKDKETCAQKRPKCTWNEYSAEMQLD